MIITICDICKKIIEKVQPCISDDWQHAYDVDDLCETCEEEIGNAYTYAKKVARDYVLDRVNYLKEKAKHDTRAE